MLHGSLRPLTCFPASHFFLSTAWCFVAMCAALACVGRQSHHGASVSIIMRCTHATAVACLAAKGMYACVLKRTTHAMAACTRPNALQSNKCPPALTVAKKTLRASRMWVQCIYTLTVATAPPRSRPQAQRLCANSTARATHRGRVC